MKHLFAPALLLLAVSTAWCSQATEVTRADTHDQVTLPQHQEAASPAALDGFDLVVGPSVDATAGSTRISASHQVDFGHVVVLDARTLLPFDGPSSPLESWLNEHPTAGHRRSVEASGPASRETVHALRCPRVTTADRTLLHFTISSGV
jgi:hypothetical protein